MKYTYTFLMTLFFISLNFAQNNSFNCDSVRSYHGFIAVERMPEPIGGIDSLQARIKYPAESRNKNITGKVYVLVYVDTMGIPRCAKILKGIGYGCDEEALRVIRSARFIPAYSRGKKIPVDVSVLLYFNPLEKKERVLRNK